MFGFTGKSPESSKGSDKPSFQQVGGTEVMYFTYIYKYINVKMNV
jgi:hypothetical protein